MILGLQSLAGKILRSKDLRPILARAGLVARAVFATFASSMMKQVRVRRKVRCHKEAVNSGISSSRTDEVFELVFFGTALQFP